MFAPTERARCRGVRCDFLFFSRLRVKERQTPSFVLPERHSTYHRVHWLSARTEAVVDNNVKVCFRLIIIRG